MNVERGWSVDRYGQFLTDGLVAALVGDRQ